MKKLKQLFCRHIWTDYYIVHETLWPYTMSWQKVRRCEKCGRILKRAQNE